MHKILWDCEIQTDHPIPARRPDLEVINKKNRYCQLVNFAVPANHRVKIKESEKIDNYLDFVKKQKMLWNMRVTVLAFVVGALETVLNSLKKA